MKNILKNKWILLIVVLVVGIIIGKLISPSANNKVVDSNNQKVEASKDQIWTCSMHPQIRQNEPGLCPLCGMDLIPLEENGVETDPMAINMSNTAMQLANISTAVVGKIKPVKTIRLNGKIQTDERLVVSQSSHIPGRIERITVNFTGEFVNKGQEIAAIYSPELVTAQEELLETQKIKDLQPQLFNASKEKLKNWKLTENQIEQILQTGKTKEIFPMLADVSGYVTKKMVNMGDYVRKGEMIYEIANLSSVWLLFDVYESDMIWIKKGDKVAFTVQSIPGETFEGKITYLDPIIDPKTRVAKARIELANPDLKFKPEMFVSGNVEAKLPMKTDAIVIPKSAVMWTGKRSVVYVKLASEKGVNFIMRKVTLGPSLGDAYIIEEGLQEGEEIAVNGTFTIDAAAQLAGKPSMMSPEGGAVMTGHNHGGANTSESEKKPEKETIKSATINQKGKDALQPLIVDYLALKDALTADNMKEAQVQSTRLQKTLKGINMSLFKGESHTVWMKYSSEIQNALQHAQHFKEIGELRTAFQTVSDGMIGIISSFKPYNKTLYIEHCPMANDNKGADWLSLEEKIKNPYFGSKMLDCGSVKETIK